MLNIKKLTPICLRHNPNWVYFFNTVDVVWADNVVSHIPNLSISDYNSDTSSLTREDILLRASRFGWTFADNFSANWEDDDRAERFLKRFIESWIPYCRSYAGTLSLASYMSYLLGMEIRIVQLWCNEKDEWDTKPLTQLFRIEETQLPEDYLVQANAHDPFYTTEERPESSNLRSVSELNNKFQGWKTIDLDPVNGWYPTSYFDVYVDLDQVPKSDLQEKSAEEIIAGLFYELADICQVLRAVVYSYGFTQIVKVASGASIMNRMGNYTVPNIPLQIWGNWSVKASPTFTSLVIHYAGEQTDGARFNDATANFSLSTALMRSFNDTDMQQWQGFKDAVTQLTGVTDWVIDSANSRITYTSSGSCADFASCPTHQYLYQNQGRLYTSALAAAQSTIDGLIAEVPTRSYSFNSTTCPSSPTSAAACAVVYNADHNPPYTYTVNIATVVNPEYDPSAENNETGYFTYLQVAQSIVANVTSSDQGVALLAETYVQAVADSVFSADPTKQFVTLDELVPQFEDTKVLRT